MVILMIDKNELKVNNNYGTINKDLVINNYNHYEFATPEINVKKHYKLPNKYKLFTGRSKELHRLNESFKESTTVILAGIGGIGKSQIAKKYIFDTLNYYNLICWVNAKNETDLNAEFRRIASYFKLDVNVKDADIDIVIETVKYYFSKSENNMIVFDGVDEVQANNIVKYIPRENTKVLITTQNLNYDTDIFTLIKVKDIRKEDAIELILNNTSNRKRTEIDNEETIRLVELLYCYPLAIEHARAFINRNHDSITNYCKLFEKESINLFSNELNEYELTALTTFSLSFNKAIKRQKESYKVLAICSLVNNTEIPYEEIFLKNEYMNINLFWSATESLLNYSLIEVKGSFVNLHAIIQKNMILELKQNQEFPEYVLEVFEILRNIIPTKITNEKERNTARLLVPHISRFIRLILDNEQLQQETIGLSKYMGQILYGFGEYQTSLYFMELTYGISVQLNDIETQIDVTNGIAITYHYLSKVEKAFSYANKAINMLKQHYETIDSVVWNRLNSSINGNLGIMYKVRRDFDKSLSCYEKALTSAQMSDDKELIISQLNNIGINYKNRGDYISAIIYYDRAIEVKCDDEIINRKALVNKGVVLRIIGEYKEAKQIFEKDLAIVRRLGSRRDECIDLFNLGICNYGINEEKNTFNLLNSALVIADDINLQVTKVDILIWLGEAYLKFHKNLDKSIHYLNDAYNLAMDINYPSGIEYTMKKLNFLRNNSGNFRA